MSMYMDGFHWSLIWWKNDNSTHYKNQTSCLVYLAPEWTLTNARTFKSAMAYAFLMGLLTEAVTVVMEHMLKPLALVVTSTGTDNTRDGRRLVTRLLAVVYGLRQGWGYLIMLVAMTFSMELLCSVLAGLMVGHFVFSTSLSRFSPRQRRQQRHTIHNRTQFPSKAQGNDEDNDNDEDVATPLLSESRSFDQSPRSLVESSSSPETKHESMRRRRR